jgi:methylase of polypeptide subunit release factors
MAKRDSYPLDSTAALLGAAIGLGTRDSFELSDSELRLIEAIPPIDIPPTKLADLRRRIRLGEDPLGEAFSQLRSPGERRSDGATYTPGPLIRAMIRWAARGPKPEVVVDPGSGSGRFLVAAGHEFPKAELIAVELDPLAALMARANLRTRGLAKRSKVVVDDFRMFEPEQRKGMTLYIGNPPYVRHHQISPKWKRWLVKQAASKDLKASQLAGLHVYFFLTTALRAQPGDRGVFITSSEWLDVNYGALVRELILGRLGGESLHVLEPEVKPFEDADTTGAITCFEIGSKPSSIKLRRVDAVKSLGSLASGQPIRRERLAEARRWSPLTLSLKKVPPGQIELGELCRVHRGAVTGANRIWVVDPSLSDLPESVLFRSVTKARELFAAGDELTDAEDLRCVIDIPEDLDSLSDDDRKEVERFLRAAKRLGIHNGYVARHRRPWWSVGLREPAPILATYMARRPPAFVRNETAARHINIAHGLYPREPLSDEILGRLAAVLGTSIELGQGRRYAGGLTKFEPKEMERLLIPDVTTPGA